MRGCSERESEIAREIWREKMNAGRSRDIARRRKKRGGEVKGEFGRQRDYEEWN